MHRFLLVAGALAVIGSAACEEKKKPPARTKPWPAPAVSSPAAPLGSSVPYTLESGTVRVDLRAKKTRFTATLSALEGRLELDAEKLDRTRGSVRVDLLGLELAPPDRAAEPDATATLSALRALELAGPSNERRDRDRWAEIRVVGFEPPPAEDLGARARKTPVTAFAELTLHRFRVPLTLNLEIEPSGVGFERLVVRTRGPLAVSLAAHDILPRDASGAVSLASPPGFAGGVPREARVSAELSFRVAAPPTPAPSANP